MTRGSLFKRWKSVSSKIRVAASTGSTATSWDDVGQGRRNEAGGPDDVQGLSDLVAHEGTRDLRVEKGRDQDRMIQRRLVFGLRRTGRTGRLDTLRTAEPAARWTVWIHGKDAWCTAMVGRRFSASGGGRRSGGGGGGDERLEWDNEEGAGVVESESSLGRDRRTDDLLDRG